MIDTQTKQKALKLGQRIRLQEQSGTIKFLGELDGHKGTWCGIDWDDPVRGKHNGTVNGKQYFKASHETSGSFVRPEKLEIGISIIETINARYGQKDYEETMKLNEQELLQLEHLCNAPFCKLIGFDQLTSKQGNYKDLTVLGLRMQNVSDFGEPLQFSNMCPNVVDLDISRTLFNTWEEIFQMVSELSHLQVLNVSENRLTVTHDISHYKITHLQTIACGSMNLTWKEIKMLYTVFTNIENIYAPKNLITTIDCDPSNLPNLKTLDIAENLLSDWNEVMKLNKLPLLNNLNLCSLKMSCITIDDEASFQSLERLGIKYNMIDNLKSISELNKLKNLNSLGLMGNPIACIETHALANEIIVAMIEKLQFLNGIDVRAERKGSEIDYLKKFGMEWLACKNDAVKRESFLNTHTRYLDLIERHGEMEESELKVQAKTIKESLIDVSLVCNERLIKKRLPPSLQIQKLVTLCQRLFHLLTVPKLVYISQQEGNIEFDLDETQELSFYSVQSGDKIVVKC